MSNETKEIIQLMRQMQGVDISPYNDAFLLQSVRKRQAVTGVKTAADYCMYLEENRAEMDAFSRSLNVTHSEFFREPLTFALLEQSILPGLIVRAEQSGRAEVRVWSAGCAHGQEAYSLGILLDELVASRGHSVAARIFATARSDSELAGAQRGVYDSVAVQNVPLKHLRSCFSQQGENYTVSSRIRDTIAFSTYDLLDEHSACPPGSIYGDFDLVMCSNLLFYYRPRIQRSILSKVYDCLALSGYLVTGEVERGVVAKSLGFRPVSAPAAVFQKS